MSKFKIGDRVKCIKGTAFVQPGDTGTVMEDNSDFPDILWDGKKYVNSSKRYYAKHEDNIELISPKFTKADLKTGMILEKLSGELAMVLLGTANGDIVSGQTWYPLSDTTDKELFEDESDYYSLKAVYQPKGNRVYLNDGLTKNNCTVVWKRETVKKLTVAEISKLLGYTVKVTE